MHLVCLMCGKKVHDPKWNRCPDCQGAIDTIYDLTQTSIGPPTTPNVLQRYFSLLPLQLPESALWLGEGNTPCFEVPELARRLGVGRLFFKDESANPTRSTKDRIASVGLSQFAELGVHRLVLASTGNSSTAYARAAQMIGGFTLDIFVGREFVRRLNYHDHPAVNTHVVDGEFIVAGSVGRRFAERNGYFWEGGFFNPSRREGLKLAYLEAFDAMGIQPDYVFQAVSSGMGLVGAYKGAAEYVELGRLERLPAFVAVQQESCAPMATAFAEGAEAINERHIVQSPVGIAEAILRGNPTASYPYIRGLCMRSGGTIEAVSETAIRAAHAELTSAVGLRPCYSSAAAFAGAWKLAGQGRLARDAVLLVNLTGADRPGAPVPARICDHSPDDDVVA